jgi:hypothetical protein
LLSAHRPRDQVRGRLGVGAVMRVAAGFEGRDSWYRRGWGDRILPHLRPGLAPTIPHLRQPEATPASVDEVRRSGQEDRVPMIRWIATVAAGVALSAGPAPAAPPSVPATSQSLQQPAPDTNSPAQLMPPASSNRKPHAGGGHSAWDGNVMRGSDTPSLVAMLPWWRTNTTQPGSDPGELESPILTACDVWLGFPFATADVQSLTVRLWTAQNVTEIDLVANRVRVADPGEFNEIDLAAPDTPPSSGKSWLGGLLAILGAALAAFSAVRYLVA